MFDANSFGGLWVVRDLLAGNPNRSYLYLTGVAFYDDLKDWHVPFFTKPDIASLFRDVVCKRLPIRDTSAIIVHHISTLGELRDVLVGLLAEDRVLVRIDEDDPARIDVLLQQVIDVL